MHIDWSNLPDAIGAAPGIASMMTARRKPEPHEDDDEGDERRSAWRMLPIAVILFLAGQTGAAIWWASQVSAAQASTTAQIIDLKQSIYTRAEAALAQQLLAQRNAECERRISAMEDRVMRHMDERNGGKAGP